MDRILIDRLVAKVVRRLAVKLGADGNRGDIVCVFSGCNGNVENAVEQMRSLIMKGFKLKLLFSENARKTYSKNIILGLDGFPHITNVDPGNWYETLNDVDIVIAPIVSLNTVSKLSMLMADSVHTQVMLNATSMGIPLLISQTDILAGSTQVINTSRRQAIKRPGLFGAIEERLAVIESYGNILCDITELNRILEQTLGNNFGDKNRGEKENGVAEVDPESPTSPGRKSSEIVISKGRKIKHLTERVITGSCINLADRGGYDISFDSGAILTPTAKDLAAQKGVTFHKL